MKKFILPVLGLGAWVTAALLGPIAAGITSGATEVLFLTPHKPEVVSVNKDLWDFDPPDPKTPNYDRKLIEVYGLVGSTKEKVVGLDRSKLLFPAGKNKDGTEKRPDLFVLPVDKEKGENPLQAKTVEFVAHLLRGGAVIVGAGFLILWALGILSAPAAAGRSPASDAH